MNLAFIFTYTDLIYVFKTFEMVNLINIFFFESERENNTFLDDLSS